jgi:uncharacterized protein
MANQAGFSDEAFIESFLVALLASESDHNVFSCKMRELSLSRLETYLLAGIVYFHQIRYVTYIPLSIGINTYPTSSELLLRTLLPNTLHSSALLCFLPSLLPSTIQSPVSSLQSPASSLQPPASSIPISKNPNPPGINTIMSFTFANYHNPAPAELPTDFTISAKAKTDLWDKPPSTHSFDCPILYRTIKMSSFKRARVAVSAEWKDLYDQGGLCLIVRQPGDGTSKWVKTGIELFDGAPHLSTVATDPWSDWSLRPMPSSGGTGATVEMSREKDGSLWIYLLEGVRRSPMREITSFFHGDGQEECWVGVYTAKPSGTGDLEVSFSHLVIETD